MASKRIVEMYTTVGDYAMASKWDDLLKYVLSFDWTTEDPSFLIALVMATCRIPIQHLPCWNSLAAATRQRLIDVDGENAANEIMANFPIRSE